MAENEIGIPGQIKLTNVGFSYQKGARPALVDINLTINQGEMVALIGHSGSGKSTLAQIISGIFYQDEGIVKIGGVRLSKKGTFRQVGMVFQYPEQQLFGETVFEDVAFGAKNFGADPMDLPGLVRAALIMVGLDPQAFMRRQPFALSGGEKRRVAIAGIMVTDPEILIFDEPTAGLDSAGRQWIISLAKRYNQAGKTVIWISHNMEEVGELAQRVLILDGGRLVADGTPREVFAKEAELSARGLAIPVATQVVRRLKEQGQQLPAKAVTVDEAYEEISAWLRL